MIADEIKKPHLHTTKEWKVKAKEWVKGKKCQWCGSEDNLAVHHIFHTEMVRKYYRYTAIQELIKEKMEKGEIPANYKFYTTFKCVKCGRNNASINASFTSRCTFANRVTYTSVFRDPYLWMRFKGDMDHFNVMKVNAYDDKDLGYGTCEFYTFDEEQKEKRTILQLYVKSEQIKILDTFLDEEAFKIFVNGNEKSINQKLAKIALPNPFILTGFVQKERKVHTFEIPIDTANMDISKEPDYMDFSIDTIVLCRDCHFAYKDFDDICPICNKNRKKRWNKTCISCKEA